MKIEFNNKTKEVQEYFVPEKLDDVKDFLRENGTKILTEEGDIERKKRFME